MIVILAHLLDTTILTTAAYHPISRNHPRSLMTTVVDQEKEDIIKEECLVQVL